ncbi:ATP synthase F1 subunit epsilon [Ancrocorticia populi]|uniref:ATP synthase F1 subunit epsilon n=1 Tax=Ancrocorticia populi TaxID=2175228 RepID=A0A2V1K4K5_9ACTO|nr:ATP synthase F1 subunit epsilon [Ancrocorticia populi]MDN6486020.1 ATP synthase F1 subunit epsilon [Ancrocorticia sp.]PWF24375.1 ATP synthase F1 subunit epsilon [Ancrocorticia populi]
MLLEIVSPAGVVWTGQAEQIRIPSVGGEMGILAGHTPLMAGLEQGSVIVDTPEGTKLGFSVSEGLVTVDSDHIYVVVQSAEKQEA